jgi:hypothetical protein
VTHSKDQDAPGRGPAWAIFYSSDGFVFGRIDHTRLPSEREVRPIRACAVVLGLMVGSDWHQLDAVTIPKREGRAPQHT